MREMYTAGYTESGCKELMTEKREAWWIVRVSKISCSGGLSERDGSGLKDSSQLLNLVRDSG